MKRMNSFAGIFLVSLATLLLELSLTRSMSVALWYHFGFLVISTALMGFGAAGVALASWKWLREEVEIDKALSALSLMLGLVATFSFWLLQRIPFNPFSVASDPRQLYIMPLYYLTTAAPFFISGLIVSILFTRLTKDMNKLYAVDLMGAAMGCLFIVWTMPTLGGSGSVVMAAALGALAAVVFTERMPIRVVSLVLTVALVALSFAADTVLPITVSENKRSSSVERKPLIREWNTFSFIELVERKADPVKNTPGNRMFHLDGGTAATGMDDLSGGVQKWLDEHPDDSSYETITSYLHIPNPSVLNIGSGAGGEVLDALHRKARKITCIEMNPIINDVVQNRMNDYWGGMFRHPTVELYTEEGRNFINRSSEQYDAIVSLHTISNAAVASGSLSLAENYVLTTEAFEEYIDHLTPQGTILFTRPETHISRLFATGREVLANKGVTDFTKHFYSFRLSDGKKDEPSFIAFFIMKKTPFTAEEVQAMNNHVATLKGHQIRSVVDGTAGKFEVLYSPYGDGVDNIYDTVLTTPDANAFYASLKEEISPTSDDRPFFNQRIRWSSIGIDSFRDVFTTADPRAARMALENKPVAEVTLLLILLQSMALAGILILIPLFSFARQGLQFAHRWRYLAYFASLGLGFIMIEIALIQRFTLYLGQPVYTLAVIIAGLLLSTGAGSYLAEKVEVDRNTLRTRAVPALLGALLLTTLLTPVLFKLTIHLPLVVRIILTLIVIAPMGFLMGVPFPTGIKLVSEESNAFVPWAWGVNGFFTVIGSVGAVIFGMMLGFKAVIFLAAIVYIGAVLLIPAKRGA